MRESGPPGPRGRGRARTSVTSDLRGTSRTFAWGGPQASVRPASLVALLAARDARGRRATETAYAASDFFDDEDESDFFESEDFVSDDEDDESLPFEPFSPPSFADRSISRLRRFVP
jgi:hypothetical protein